jgi:hypothetical protein
VVALAIVVLTPPSRPVLSVCLTDFHCRLPLPVPHGQSQINPQSSGFTRRFVSVHRAQLRAVKPRHADASLNTELQLWAQAAASLSTLVQVHEDSVAFERMSRMNKMLSNWSIDELSSDGLDGLRTLSNLESGLQEIKNSAENESQQVVPMSTVPGPD